MRSIALFEIAKGVLAVAAALGLLSLRHTDLLAVVDAFLSRHGMHSEIHYRHLFIESVAAAARLPIGQVIGFAFIYSVIRFAEGFGLWYGKHWAEWFAVISAAIYLPFEIRHLVHHRTALTGVVIILNLALIAYLIHLLFEGRKQKRQTDRSRL